MTNFRFVCYRDLHNTLGAVDAIVECIELSVRHFHCLAQEDVDVNNFVKQMSDKYYVKVSAINFNSLKQRASCLYLLNVYQQFEQYLRDLRKEYPLEDSWSDDKNRSLFLNTLDNLRNKNKVITSFEIDLIEHYRLVRNYFMHSIDIESCNQNVKVLRSSVIKDKVLYKYSAPNMYDQIEFDDFLLFTKVVKDVAIKMCIIGKPTDDYIIEMLVRRPTYDSFQKGIKKLKNNSTRATKAIQGFIFSEYCMPPEESENIVNIFLNRILA